MRLAELEPNFARVVSPLSKQLRETQAKELRPFTEEELIALETLKEKRIFAGIGSTKEPRIVQFRY